MADIKPGPGQIVTANEIMSGQVVFLTPQGGWSTDPAEAAFAESREAAEALLARGLASNARSEAELVALIAAGRDAGGRPYPTRKRERIRALGPTVRRDLGYQAERRA